MVARFFSQKSKCLGCLFLVGTVVSTVPTKRDCFDFHSRLMKIVLSSSAQWFEGLRGDKTCFELRTLSYAFGYVIDMKRRFFNLNQFLPSNYPVEICDSDLSGSQLSLFWCEMSQFCVIVWKKYAKILLTYELSI